MAKPIVLLTVGISASGKTSWAEGFIRNRDDWINLNRDDIRFALFTKGVRDFSQYKFTNANEKRVTEVIEERAKWARYNKRSILISDTNLNPKTRAKWLQWAKEHDYEYLIKEFPTTFDDARRRNIQREGGVSESVLWNQYLRMNEYLERKTYIPNTEKPKAVIIDVDGTIADMAGVRKPYEWDKVLLDKPRKEIICMIQGLIDYTGVQPIFLSGRDAICKDLTYSWIKEYVTAGEDFYLFMRQVGDMRKDKVVKEEIFWKYIASNFYVIGAIDDRASILTLWRELNIPNVVDVSGDRYYEF